jgi:hypothetical protein
MNQPSRRQFFGASLAGLPVIVGLGTDLFGTPKPSFASQPQSPRSADPVLESMVAELDGLRKEGDAKPSARKGIMRATEALTGAMAVHLGQHYDPQLKANIKRLGLNRQDFVQQVATKLNNPEFTDEKVEAALKLLQRDGLQEVLLEARRVCKRVRENAPEVLQVKMQYDYCADLRWMIDLAEMMAAIACVIAIYEGGTNFAADGACGAMQLQVAVMRGFAAWFGC